MKRSRFMEKQIIGILKEHQAGLGAKELPVSDDLFCALGAKCNPHKQFPFTVTLRLELTPRIQIPPTLAAPFFR